MQSLTETKHRLGLLKRAEPLATEPLATTPRQSGAAEAPVEDKVRDHQPSIHLPIGTDKKKTIVAVIGTSLLLGLGMGVYQWVSFATSHEATDDAYTTAHMHPVSPRINDNVLRVLVDDNEHVHAGQLLAQLDQSDFQVKVEQAQAALEVAKHQLATAQGSVELSAANATGKSTEAAGTVDDAAAAIARAQAAAIEAQSSIPESQAQLAQRQAEEHRAAADFERYEKLAQQGAVSIQQRDQAARDYQVAVNATKAAQETVNQARARAAQAQVAVRQAKAQYVRSQGILQEARALDFQTRVNTDQFRVAQAAVRQAEAQLKDAQLQLSYTNIVAPVDGRIGKKAVEPGQRVQPGQDLFDVVGDDLWVVANFKETQLERMRPGEKVDITIDSFPHHKFTGRVDSLSPGSGASFALLPPENATGNFTKIVQRVPVKVVFDRDSIKGYENLLGPGMSAVVDVAVGK